MTQSHDQWERGCGHLNNAGVGEGVEETIHEMSQLQGVDDVVMATSGDLHKTHKSLEGPVGMILRKRERERKI